MTSVFDIGVHQTVTVVLIGDGGTANKSRGLRDVPLDFEATQKILRSRVEIFVVRSKMGKA